MSRVSPPYRALVLVTLLSGCSLLVEDALKSAEAQIVPADEGEGEEGEGEEGEGEGEGEIPDTDPACEAEERLLVVRGEDELNVLQVYDMTDGGLRRRTPEGFPGNVNLDNDDVNAQNNGTQVSAVALGSEDRLYLVGDRFLYQLRASTLQQQNITGRVMLTLAGFGNYDTVQMLGDRIIVAGNDIKSLDADADVGATATTIHDGDEYSRSTAFSIDGTDYVAISAEHGWAVLSSTAGSPPSTSAVDEEFDTDRIHDFGDGFPPKGIAFDATTGKLLFGDLGRIIVIHPPAFLLPDEDTDYVLPDGDTPDVIAIAARAGFAYVLLRRSQDNLVKLDLSTSPPRGVAIATVGSGFGRSIAVGCRRVVVADLDAVIALDRDDLSPAGTLTVRNATQVQIVPRARLGLLGDD